jgi:UDP-glucose 4-epimerase
MINFKGTNVLVTGGAGFVGSHLVDALVERGANVTVYDNLSTGCLENVSTKARLVRADVLDRASLQGAMVGQKCVFHFAANADVRHGLENPFRDLQQNWIATHNVLEAMRAGDVKEIAFASTGSVYGEPTEFPTPEEARFPVQTSLYGASKVGAEGLLTAYAHGFGFNVKIFRFVSMLGHRYSHGHVIDFWRKLKADPTEITVLGNGNQNKSYLHVSDAINGVIRAFESDSRSIEIYNVSHWYGHTVRDNLDIIVQFMKVHPKVTFLGGKRGWIGDSPRILLDANRLRFLGWEPKWEIVDALLSTLRWLEKSLPEEPS